MGKDSKIGWTTNTFNCWRGCTKVSPGCKFCYAETLSSRNPAILGVWGPSGTRVVASEAKWREVYSWDRNAIHGERPRVFCASPADVFEAWDGPMVNARSQVLHDHVLDWRPESDGARGPLTMDDVRIRLWKTIVSTPRLDWLLLTKRPENVLPTLRRMKAIREERLLVDNILGAWIDGRHPPDNLWLGTSVEDRAAKARIDILREIPAAIRFLSIEPLIEDLGTLDLRGIDWVIVGGESGPKARPFDLAWARSIIGQCKTAGAACFVKQIGAKAVTSYYDEETRRFYDQAGWDWPDPIGWRIDFDGQPPLRSKVDLKLRDSHGGDWDEWPTDLRVRQFPGEPELADISAEEGASDA